MGLRPLSPGQTALDCLITAKKRQKVVWRETADVARVEDEQQPRCIYVAAVLTINQTYNILGLYDSVADSQILLLNNQSIVQLEVHLLGIKVSHSIFIALRHWLQRPTFYVGAHKLGQEESGASFNT